MGGSGPTEQEPKQLLKLHLSLAKQNNRWLFTLNFIIICDNFQNLSGKSPQVLSGGKFRHKKKRQAAACQKSVFQPFSNIYKRSMNPLFFSLLCIVLAGPLALLFYNNSKLGKLLPVMAIVGGSLAGLVNGPAAVHPGSNPNSAVFVARLASSRFPTGPPFCLFSCSGFRHRPVSRHLQL